MLHVARIFGRRGSASHVGGTLTIGIATNRATLNQDFTKSDGKPFSSADVAYTIQDVLKYNPLELASLQSDLKSVSANGPYTVVVTRRHPMLRL